MGLFIYLSANSLAVRSRSFYDHTTVAHAEFAPPAPVMCHMTTRQTTFLQHLKRAQNIIVHLDKEDFPKDMSELVSSLEFFALTRVRVRGNSAELLCRPRALPGSRERYLLLFRKQ